MRPGIFLSWRNAHQSDNIEAEFRPAKGDEIHRVLRGNARLLWLQPGIDLHIQPQTTALLGHFLGQGACDLFPVHRFNHIE